MRRAIHGVLAGIVCLLTVSCAPAPEETSFSGPFTTIGSLTSHEYPDFVTAAVVSRDVYVLWMGGEMTSFNVDSGVEITRAQMPAPADWTGGAVVVTGNTMYVSGGKSSSTTLTSLWAYDLLSGNWATLAPMSLNRSGHCMVAESGNLYAIAGASSPASNNTEEYNIGGNSWSTKSTSIAGSINGVDCAVDNGNVYVFPYSSTAATIYDASIDSAASLSGFGGYRSGVIVYGGYIWMNDYYSQHHHIKNIDPSTNEITTLLSSHYTDTVPDNWIANEQQQLFAIGSGGTRVANLSVYSIDFSDY